MGRDPGKAVLLVENDPEQARLIRAMFKDQDSHAFELACAKSMKEAEKHLVLHQVNVILLDLHCPIQMDCEPSDISAGLRPAPPSCCCPAGKTSRWQFKLSKRARRNTSLRVRSSRSNSCGANNAVERMRIESILFNEMDRAQVTLDSIADAVICTDVSGNISFLNPVAERMTGWSLKEAAGRPVTESLRIVDAASRKTILNPMAKAASEDRTGELPLNSVLIHRNGHELFYPGLKSAAIHGRDGQVTGAVIVFRDVSAARAQSEQITHLAETIS